MEDWQEWQVRADQIATDLGLEVEALTATFFGDEGQEFNYRGFWPKFKDLKERVRTAPAIRLEAKLDLERRLRTIGSRAYRAQEVVYARSSERKNEVLERISSLKATAERETAPRNLRNLRRDFDRLREEFDTGSGLVPPDRQAVWDAWRDANQFAWQRLVDLWTQNEVELREALTSARQSLEKSNAQAARFALGRFFELLKTREAKQDSLNAMKAEVDAIRRETDQLEERAIAQRAPAQQMPSVPAVETWRNDLARNREAVARLSEEVSALDQQMQASTSILEHAMVRGTLVDKKRKLDELERSNRVLAQKIEQTEESPLIFSA